MTWLQIAADFGTFASALAAVVAIAVAIRTYKRQTNAQVFLECTARYQEVMASFPATGRHARLDLEGDLPDASEDLSIAVLRYLNLCSEEYYLWKRNYLADEVWQIWERELKRTLASPLLRREWKELRREFEAYPDFMQEVDDVHRAAAQEQRGFRERDDRPMPAATTSGSRALSVD